MEHNLDDLVLYKESMNDALNKITLDVLDENGIRYKYEKQVVGVKYKKIYHQIFVHKDDVEKADACLDNDIFADIPWDPESDNADPNPKLPWYLDAAKKNKVSKIFGVILGWTTIILIILAFVMMAKQASTLM